MKINVFGIRVKQELNAQGKTQNDLCMHLNVCKSTVSQWINGIYEPSLVRFIEIAKFLEVSTDYLLGLED
ncbi:MAG: helix-turn-helix domain-containing protein [Clostridia bacterium]|nr:helix-turn-helix domain-containing protein [Clostridia bacterium]